MTEVVRCATHGHYLKHASVGGTSWTDDRAAARRYEPEQVDNAVRWARWLDHDPIVEDEEEGG